MKAVPEVQKLARWNLSRILQENIHDKIRDLWPPSRFFLFVASSRPARRNSLNATEGVHRTHFLERATVHFFSWAHTAHSVAQDKVVSASFIVIPHAHCHPVSLMSLLNVKLTPFPSLLSSPCTSSSGFNVTSRPHKKLVSISRRTRSLEGVWRHGRFRSKPRKWAQVRRLLQLHGSGAQPDRHPRQQPDFRFTMISGSARGLPNSEALCSSRRAAVSSLFGHTR